MERGGEVCSLEVATAQEDSVFSSEIQSTGKTDQSWRKENLWLGWCSTALTN